MISYRFRLVYNAVSGGTNHDVKNTQDVILVPTSEKVSEDCWNFQSVVPIRPIHAMIYSIWLL